MKENPEIKLSKVGFPRWSIFLLTFQQGLVGSLVWGAVFALTTAVQAVAFVAAYPTEASRIQAAAILNSNTSFQAMIGLTTKIDTVAGYTQWKGLDVAVIILAILGYLMATRFLRGEEEKGRDEIMLAGQTNFSLAVIQKYLGITANVFVISAISTIAMYVVGKPSNIGISFHQSFDLGLIMFLTMMLFVAIGGFFAEIFPTRTRANLFSIIIFSLAYLLRAAADSADKYSYLRNYTPFGWIENFQALTGDKTIWLLPLIILIIVLIAVSIYFAAHRDLYGSVLAEKDTAKAKTKLLSSSFTFSFRQSYPAIVIWIIALAAASAFYAGVAKTAVEFVKASAGIQNTLGALSNTNQSVAIYVGLIFMLFMIAIMVMPAGFIAGLRNEEASGELDTLITQPVSRTNWLWGKILLIFSSVVVASLVTSLTAWFFLKTQNIDLVFSKMFYTGINLAVPAIFLLGIGVLVFAILPRWTSVITYAVIASSFLIEMLASVVKNQKWILDFSVLYHMNYAPAADPNWHNNWILIGIGIAAAILGVLIFSQRDIVNE